MPDLPPELYTPIFTVARMAGWIAHRMEDLINMDKTIRPAYAYVGGQNQYIPIAER